MKTGKRHLSLIGHSAEISAGKFNYDGSIVVSGSMDGTMRLWEAESGTPLGKWFEKLTEYFNVPKITILDRLKAIFRQFEDEVLDVAFSLNSQYVAGCSADGESKIFHVASKREIGDMEGHLDAEISKIQFSPNGNRVITTSADKTLKWVSLKT